MKIKSIHALEILDSRANPTIKTYITLEDGSVHASSVPSGASTGLHEAVELRDNDPARFGGKGVLKAVENVNTILAQGLVDSDISYPDEIDQHMFELDPTENKSKLGANAILSVSLSATQAAAYASRKPLWKFIHDYYFADAGKPNISYGPSFPRLMVNIVNGGKHANWAFDIQEFMVIPTLREPSKSIQVSSEIFHALGELLKSKNLSTLVGDEGGYAPALSTNDKVITTIIEAATKAGYTNGQDYNIGLDLAASEWLQNGKYISYKTGKEMSQNELIEYYQLLTTTYKLLSIEDPFAEDDWDAWQKITGQFKDVFIVGDDLFTTDPKRIQKGIEKHAAHAVIIKPNQIGTVLETVEAIKTAREAGWKVVISHRSGETDDTFIADLAYGCGADFLKAGSVSRGERIAKYNRLLEIEKGL